MMQTQFVGVILDGNNHVLSPRTHQMSASSQTPVSAPAVEPIAREGKQAAIIYETFVEACRVREVFLTHLKQTQEPETFPGLSHVKPPEKDAVFLLVVQEFDVDPSKRPDGELIRCAACGTKKKFRRGSLAWYPAEGVIRVVGNECGDSRRAEANADYNRRASLKFVNEYLLESLPRVKSLLQQASAMRPRAQHAQELSLQLKTQARSFCTYVLAGLKDGDGKLEVYESEADEQTVGLRRVAVAVPAGTNFMRNSFQPLRRVDEALLRFKTADRGDEETAFKWQLQNHDDLSELETCYQTLTEGFGKLLSAETMIGEAAAFLSRANLEGIDRWSDALHNNQLRAKWDPGRIIFSGPPRVGSKLLQSAILKPNWKLLGVTI